MATKIERIKAKLAKLEEKIGELCAQRVALEEQLADAIHGIDPPCAPLPTRSSAARSRHST